ncbi:MAG TPA: outer membrane beta-barrel protein [Bacteroidales bacterium]|nr:outer membrane beta-barrel protein [Bacteroidales bacterium]HOX73341.1 outer membrane beta-barrel protein [Bacteroidales bacterium]HPM86561.1 outer membrane beta-barrel protein [Bacteroidales bacterium]HQM67837.1 outer membrane beta-barrel protein [Bacteroidales bacterium]
MKTKILHMRKLGTVLLLMLFLGQGFGQKTSAARDTVKTDRTVSDTSEIMKVVVGKDRIIIEDDDDALQVKMGNRKLIILESLEEGKPRISVEKYDEDTEIDKADEYNNHNWQDPEDERAERRNRFRGHWAGFEFGFNNYVVSDYSLTLPESIDYMSLHSGKSNNFNFNVAQTSLGLARRIGFVTGLGLNWNNYRFDGNNNIIKNESGIIEEYDPGSLLKKSKFSTLYLTLPVLLEFQIPADHNHLNIAAGPIGAVKLYSYSKMVFDEGDKVRSEDDFSLNMLRYGVTARIGYENLQVYGTYYITPLFQTGKGPGSVDLFPFEIGLAFTID